MTLHEYMLPEALPIIPALKDLKYSNLPSMIFLGFDPNSRTLLSREGLRALTNEGALEEHLSPGYKNQRRTIIQNAPFCDLKDTFYIDFEDARYQPREYSFGRDFNVFQYNRRKGDRTSILWRLSSYFEPTPSLGHPPRGFRGDSTDYADKINKIFWRGGMNGSIWSDPNSRTGIQSKDLESVRTNSLNTLFSRLRIVADDSLGDIVDAKFTSEPNSKVIKKIDDQKKYFSPPVLPADMLEYKYLLCPAGNDVSSSLYWILNSNSIPFRETVDYEVIPDYYLKPWVHYVPLSPGMLDIRDKFDFCERNDDLCKQIVENGKIAYQKILDKKIWEAAEWTVLERLNLLR